jgi:hypothetical protein
MDRMRGIDITLWVNIYVGKMWGIPGIAILILRFIGLLAVDFE